MKWFVQLKHLLILALNIACTLCEYVLLQNTVPCYENQGK